jgi:hypothetical protein
MTRTLTILLLAVLLVGCSRFQSYQGPFSKPTKEPPPPYGAVPPVAAPRPTAGQSPLGFAAADNAPAPPSGEPSLIPPDVSGPATAAAPTPAARNLADLKALVAAATAAWKAIDTYETVQTRRELNPKGQINNETVFIQFRREPMSVYVLNVGESGKGRETIYNPTKFEDKLHVKLGKGDPFPGAGFVAPPISPDDRRVKEKARYSIREAGFIRMINALGAAVGRLEAGKIPADALTYDGEVRRDEFPFAVTGVTHKLRPGDDPLMPVGGTRQYFFDTRKGSPAFAMPVLVTAIDSSQQETEYYLFEKVKQPANLTDAEFDPARIRK